MNNIFSTETGFSDNSIARERKNRIYLLSQSTADELNVYRSFKAFPVFNDVYAIKYELNPQTGHYEEVQLSDGAGAPGTRSLFNAAGSVMIGSGSEDPKEASEWRISNNVPLIDSPSNRERMKEHSKCTITDLVEASQKGMLGRATYAYSDFMYCKHLGKMPNNYLITLRRFPTPVDDYISSTGVTEMNRSNDKIASNNPPSIGCLVTWMGTPGNDMNNILSYNYSMPFEFKEAEWNDEPNADSSKGFLNQVASLFDDQYRKQYMLGQADGMYNEYIDRFFKGKVFEGGNAAGPYKDQPSFRDSNKVYGPVDAVKGTYKRSEKGLTWDQKFQLVFDYELRSYNGINGRQAMLDLISNILAVTYSQGTFWGGGYKPTGAHQNNIFTNMKIFQTHGGPAEFFEAFAKDLSTVGEAAKDKIQTSGGIIEFAKQMLNQLGGMILGGMLNKLGRPSKIMTNSLLSEAPVGFWHVTVGNPKHPIMSMGNMILTDTKIEHYGPLGMDDFPTGIRVTCQLERGKPRDSAEIERLYMNGQDRIYTTMGPKVLDMYKNAQDSRTSHNSVSEEDPYEYNGGIGTIFEIQAETENTNIQQTSPQYQSSEQANVAQTQNTQMSESDVYKKYFGTDDTRAIVFTAMEQGYGGSSKKSQN